MVSRSKKMRKKFGSHSGDHASLKKSLKELDRMSIELVDKLFEINARIDLPESEEDESKSHEQTPRLARILNRFQQRIEKMKLTYRDIYTL